MRTKVLITGTTGMVGRNLVPFLIRNNIELLEVTRKPKVSSSLFGNDIERYILTDNQDLLRNRIEEFNPDICIHLAAFLSSSDDYDIVCKLINSNIGYTCRIIDALKNTKLNLFVNTGTFAEYSKGNNDLVPAYFYAATKTASREIVKYYSNAYNFKSTTIVPYTIYGYDDSQKKILDIIYDSLSSTEKVNLSPGNQILDFIHIDDICRFYTEIILNYKIIPDQSVFHLGTGQGHTLQEVAKAISKKTKRAGNINWGGIPYRKNDVMYAVADTLLQEKLFSWKCTMDIDEGIEKFIRYKEKK